MIALRLKTQSLEVSAPRELVFEVVASAGKKVAAEGDAQIVEYESRLGGHVFKTLERVTVERPHRIVYRWLTGPVVGVEEEILFDEIDDQTTLMSYRGNFQPPAGPLGWARGLSVVRPIFNKLVRAHLAEAKQLAEARFERSHLYPRKPRSL